MDLKQKPDGSVSLYSDQEGKDLAIAGGPKSPQGGTSATANYRIPYTIHVPLTGASASPFTAALANVKLSDDALILEKAEILYTATAPSCTFDVGFASTAGVVASTTFLTGLVTTALTASGAALTGASTSQGLNIPAGSFLAATPQLITCATFAADLYLTVVKQ